MTQKIPVALVDDENKKTFIYKEDGLPSQFFASPSGHHHTLSSASIERDEVQQVARDPQHTADAKSVFGGSQSASASMSASMHRIVEDVERLVESDTYENAPMVPEQLVFPQSAQPTSSQYFDPSTDSIFREENFPPRQTPVAPPGLGPPMASSAALARGPSQQSYTPRPSLPAIPSIWNTEFSTKVGGEASVPRSPPGLGQHPGNIMPGRIASPSSHGPSQDPAMNDLLLRQNLLGQSQLQSSLNGPNPMSPWMSTSSPASHHIHPSMSWDRASGIDVGLPSQPLSSGMVNASWANDAFLASTLTSGVGYPSSSGLSNNRRSAYGAIGQTPPCGHGG